NVQSFSWAGHVQEFTRRSPAYPGAAPRKDYSRLRKAEQGVQAAVEARLRRYAPDRQQHARRVALAARGAVRDRERLAGQPEDNLLVRDQAGEPHGVDTDAPLLPTPGVGQGDLLGAVVRVVRPLLRSEAAGRGERSAGRRVGLGCVVHLDDFDRVAEG